MTSTDNYMYWFMQWIEDENGYAYFSAVNNDEFYRYDIKKKQVIKVGRFQNVPADNQLYRGGLFLDDKVYFPPRMADKMAVYDTKTGALSYIDLYENYSGAHKESFGSNNQGYISLKDDKGNGWFIYRNSPICIRLDLCDKSLSYITCEETGKVYIIGTEYLQVKNLVYIPIKGKNLIIKLDMGNCKLELIRIGKENEHYYSITCDNDGNIFMLSYNDPGVVSWNPDTGDIKRIADLPLEKIDYENELIIRSVGEYLRIFPGFDSSGCNGHSFTVNKNTGEVTEEVLFEKYNNMIKYFMNISEDNCCFFMTEKGEDPFFTQNGRYVFYDWKQNNINEFCFPLPVGETAEEMSEKLYKYYKWVNFSKCKKDNILYLENNRFDLKEFISGVINDDKSADA